MSDTPAKQKAKGTPKTEAIIGAASNKLVTATKQLKDAAETAMRLVETADQQALMIADNEEKLVRLETEYSNRRTQQHIELELAYKADNKHFAEEYLRSTGKVAVDITEYDGLTHELKDLKTEFDNKLKAEMGKAHGMAVKEAENASKVTDLTYKAKEAENLAEIKNLQAQLKFANEQTALWKQSLDAERQAGIERSKNNAIGNVNLTSPGK